MVDITLEWIDTFDPRMEDVAELRYVALFEPFGIPRSDIWNDDIPGVNHLIATVEGAIAGYACLIVDEDRGQVRQVSVSPAQRGTGVGRALMIEVVAGARRFDLGELWLNARVTAEPFYARLGWQTTSGEFPFGRTGVPHVRMEYPLG